MAPIARNQFVWCANRQKMIFFSKIIFKLHFGPKITSKKGEQAVFQDGSSYHLPL